MVLLAVVAVLSVAGILWRESATCFLQIIADVYLVRDSPNEVVHLRDFFLRKVR